VKKADIEQYIKNALFLNEWGKPNEKIDRFVPFIDKEIQLAKQMKILGVKPKILGERIFFTTKFAEIKIAKTWLTYSIGISYQDGNTWRMIPDVKHVIPNATKGQANWWENKPVANLVMMKKLLRDAESSVFKKLKKLSSQTENKMKKSALQRIIREEIQSVMDEGKGSKQQKRGDYTSKGKKQKDKDKRDKQEKRKWKDYELEPQLDTLPSRDESIDEAIPKSSSYGLAVNGKLVAKGSKKAMISLAKKKYGGFKRGSNVTIYREENFCRMDARSKKEG